MAMSCDQVLLELGRENSRIFGVGSATTGFFGAFKREFPERVAEVGIAEQNLVAVAAGLAVAGRVVFAHGMAPFVPIRCYEQIRSYVAYGKKNVKLTSSPSGIVYGGWGVTHHTIDDVGMMRLVPGMVVMMPADAEENEKAIRAAAAHDGPFYICLGRVSLPEAYNNRPFELGKAVTLKPGKDITVIATGPSVPEAITAGDRLAQEEVDARILHMHTIKPIDREAILSAAEETRAIITIEEHNVIGGLGGAVAEVLAEAGRVGRLKRLGIQDRLCTETVPYQEMKARNGVDADAVVRTALQFM